MTLVETMMATLVTAVGVAGVAGLLVTSARTASLAELQSQATDLASAELETIRSLDYDLIGIAPTAPDFVASVDGLTTVTVVGDLIEPLEKVELDGEVFVIERSVTWVVVGADREAYKLVAVEVEFEGPSGRRQVVVQTGVHEGLSGG